MRGDHLDAIDEIRPAALEVIRDAYRVDTVRRHGKFEFGIKSAHAAAVVVRTHRITLRSDHGHGRIERGAQRLGVAVTIEDLSFSQGDLKEVHVTGFIDDSVERVSLGFLGDGGLLQGIVRFDFERVLEGRKAESIS